MDETKVYTTFLVEEQPLIYVIWDLYIYYLDICYLDIYYLEICYLDIYYLDICFLDIYYLDIWYLDIIMLPWYMLTWFIMVPWYMLPWYMLLYLAAPLAGECLPPHPHTDRSRTVGCSGSRSPAKKIRVKGQ